jgi:hypothetical protein
LDFRSSNAFSVSGVIFISPHQGTRERAANIIKTNRLPKNVLTLVLPRVGYIEEVKWDQDVVFTKASVIPYSKAVFLLKNSRENISDQDQVLYTL